MYEVRVWCEDGTLMGCATLNGSLVTFTDVVPDSGFAWPEYVSTQSMHGTEETLRKWAEDYADWCCEYCTCGTGDCGVMYEHGISIQYCRDGFTVDQFA